MLSNVQNLPLQDLKSSFIVIGLFISQTQSSLWH